MVPFISDDFLLLGCGYSVLSAFEGDCWTEQGKATRGTLDDLTNECFIIKINYSLAVIGNG